MCSLQDISLRKYLEKELSDEHIELLLRMLRYTIDLNQLSYETIDSIFNKFHEEKYFKYYPEFVNIFENKCPEWYYTEKRSRRLCYFDRNDIKSYSYYAATDSDNE